MAESKGNPIGAIAMESRFAEEAAHIERTRLLPSCNMVVARARLYLEVVKRLSQACCEVVTRL